LTRYQRYEIASDRDDPRAGRGPLDLITAGGSARRTALRGRTACDVFTFAGNAALQDGQVFSCDLTPHGNKVYVARAALWA
jgi:aldehyde dehydrogenase (NAD+)